MLLPVTYTQTRSWLQWLIGYCEGLPGAVPKLEAVLEGLTEVEQERDDALQKIEDALDLCDWVSSDKAEIKAALEGRLADDHPVVASRRRAREDTE